MIAAYRKSTWILTWLLCCAAWGGPVPVLHRHAALENDDTSYETLIEHLKVYHSQGAPAPDASEWHWHLAQCPCGIPTGSHGMAHSPSNAILESQSSASMLDSHMPQLCVSFLQDALISASQNLEPLTSRPRYGSFLMSYSSGQILSLTNVIRC